MKKLAARDFEDLLQVCIFFFFDNKLRGNFIPVFNSSIREPTSKQTPQYPDHGHALHLLYLAHLCQTSASHWFYTSGLGRNNASTWGISSAVRQGHMFMLRYERAAKGGSCTSTP
jgi:hypothetical protein